jgi:hypothetical protein
MCEATFRSSTPRSYLNITYPVYAEVNSSIELKANGKGKLELIGTTTAVYFFCEGADHNQITLTDPEDIIRVRERIANDPDYTEISCNAEAKALGGGSGEHIEGRDRSKHIEELNRKYGGDEEPEYSDRDRYLIAKLRQ